MTQIHYQDSSSDYFVTIELIKASLYFASLEMISSSIEYHADL
jgi:hypothetical protein